MRARPPRFAVAAIFLAVAFVLGACGGEAGVRPADAGGPPDAEPGAAPVISAVTWTPAAGCRVGVSGKFTIVVTVTDADTPAASLTVSGSVASCFPAIVQNPAEVTCPNVQPYPGTVTVSDPQHHTATQFFTVLPCTAGTAP